MLILSYFVLLIDVPLIHSFQKTKVAVLPFVIERVTRANADLLAELLVYELNISQTISATEFNQAKANIINSGQTDPSCFDLNCAKEFAKVLNTNYIIMGKVVRNGTKHNLLIQVVNTVDSKVIFTKDMTTNNENDLFVKLSDLASPIAASIKPISGAQVPAPQPKTKQSELPTEVKTPLPPKTVEPELPTEVKTPSQTSIQINHEPIKTISKGKAFSVQAQIQPTLGDNKLFLIYRGDGKDRFQFHQMTPVLANEYYGQISSQSITGSFEYYLRAIDKQGNELGRFPIGENSYLKVNIGKEAAVKLPERETPAEKPLVTKPPKKEITKKGGKKYLLWGLGAVAIGAGTYFILQKSDKDGKGKQLPMPPNYP